MQGAKGVELNLQAAGGGKAAVSMKTGMFEAVAVVALAAVLTTFFLGVLFGPLSLVYGPDELRAAPEVEKMVIAVFALISLAAVSVPTLAEIRCSVSNTPAAPVLSVASDFSILLC
jgi:hypothetical protein